MEFRTATIILISNLLLLLLIFFLLYYLIQPSVQATKELNTINSEDQLFVISTAVNTCNKEVQKNYNDPDLVSEENPDLLLTAKTFFVYNDIVSVKINIPDVNVKNFEIIQNSMVNNNMPSGSNVYPNIYKSIKNLPFLVGTKIEANVIINNVFEVAGSINADVKPTQKTLYYKTTVNDNDIQEFSTNFYVCCSGIYKISDMVRNVWIKKN